MGRLGARERLLRGLGDLLSEKEKEWRLVLGGQNDIVVVSIYAGPKYSWTDLMFQVPWILKFEVEHVERNWTNYFDLFVVEGALEWVVKKPLLACLIHLRP